MASRTHLSHEAYASYTPSRASTPVPTFTSPLSNKVIAITGAASGVGLALSFHLLSLNAMISIADSDQPALHHALLLLEKSHPGTSARVLPTVLDVRNSAAVDAWVMHTVERFGKLDGAANLAGVGGSGALCGRSVRELDDQDWDIVLGVSLTGVKNCVRGELQAMREAQGGSIVNGASVSGLSGGVGASCYAVSKAGVIALTKSAAKEEAPRGIRVNAIAPGFIDMPTTNSLKEASGDESTKRAEKAIPFARKGTPEEVAKAIAFLLSEDSSYMTGTVQVIDGGYTI